MCDPSDLLCLTLDATFDEDDPRPDIQRPTTPVPDRSRTLRRTISYASIDTVCPPNRKGVRRRIEDISNSLKQKKKKKHSSTQHVPKNSPVDTKMNFNHLADSNVKSQRKSVSPLRDLPPRFEEESVLDTAGRLHNGVPFEPDLPLPVISLGRKSGSLIDPPLFQEDDEVWEDCSLPIRTLTRGARVTSTVECQDTDQSPPTTKAGLEDVQLHIRSSEMDMTIWDGLHAAHHVYKCRLFLRCTTHPYESVALPDIRRVEMECNTRPAVSLYARPPALQASYDGAAPNHVTNPDGLPKVNLAAGIHMDRVWCKIQDDDGMWGWYRDAFVPLSSRLFDKTEYREFKLVGRVWVGEGCVEDGLTFGISMLLRGVDMD